MVRQLIAVSSAVLLAGGFVIPASNAMAGGNGAQPSTSVEHQFSVSFTILRPCAPEGQEQLYDITLNVRVLVEHFTEVRPEIGAGTVTQTGARLPTFL